MTARAWTAFAAVSVLWGIPYLFIKVAIDHGVSPLFLAWVRVTLAAVLLLALAHRAGVLGTVRGRLWWIAAYAVAEIALPFPLIAEGERHVSSSLTAILIAAVPTFVALLALRFNPSERVTGLRLVGLVVGFAGVIALVGIDLGGQLWGAAAVLLAAFGYAVGPMVLKLRFADLDPRAAMGCALVIAAVALTPFAAFSLPARVPPAAALASLVVLGVFCTAIAFVFFGILIAEAGPARASIITYVAPLIALALGVVALDEHVGAGAVVGLVLILGGSWLSTRTSKASPHVEEACAEPSPSSSWPASPAAATAGSRGTATGSPPAIPPAGTARRGR